MKKHYILTAKEASLGRKDSDLLADLIVMIERDFVVTVTGNVMEFTSQASPIIPVFVATRTGSNFTVAAGPGQTVSFDTLTAANAVVARRLARNRTARLAAEGLVD